MQTRDEQQSYQSKPKASSTTFWRSVRSHPIAGYRGISLGELAAYAVKVLIDNQMDCSYENVAVLLFKLFPEKFSLVGFPEYPDGKRVLNSISLDARHGGYVLGGRSMGWRLTDKGNEVAERTQQLLRGEGTRPRIQNPKAFR